MRKQIFTLLLGICAVCGFAQTQLTTEMSQQELASVYKNENGVLSRTIEIPVKYGAYDLTKEDDIFTRVVVFNYLFDKFYTFEEHDRKQTKVTESIFWKLFDDEKIYDKPQTLTIGFKCGKASQEDDYIITTRPGYVICTIVLKDYIKSGFFGDEKKNPLTVYPYTKKDKKWAAEAFVNNYNKSEKYLRDLFEEPITLNYKITPQELTARIVIRKDIQYQSRGYYLFNYGKGAGYKGEGTYALKGNKVFYIDYNTGEEKVLFEAPLDECDEPLIRAFNGNMYVVFEDVGDAIVPDAVKFYYPNGDLVYQCSTVIFDDEGKHITVANAKDVTTKNKKTGKTKTVRKGVYSSCSYDEFPNGLVEQPATLKKGMKVNDVLKFNGAEGIIKEGGTAFHVEVELVIKYNGKTYKTNVWAGGLGSLGSPYADGSYSDEKWHEQMWSLQVPSAFSDDAVIK